MIRLGAPIILLLGCVPLRFGTADNSEGEKPRRSMAALVDALLANYDRSSRPQLKDDESTELRLAYVPRHILELDYSRISMTSVGYMMMEWSDSRLSWKPSDHDNITRTFFENERVWIPEVHFFHSGGFYYLNSSEDDSPVMVKSEGLVSFCLPVNLTVPCLWENEYYPDDTATCNHYFGSWTYKGRELNIGIFNDSEFKLTMEDVTGGEWKMTKFSYKLIKRPEENEYTRNFVNFTLSVQRSAPSYKLNAILPLIYALILTLAVFLVNLGTESRYILAISNYLLTEFHFLSIGNQMPPGGDTPLLARLTSGTVGLAAFVLLETIGLDILTKRTSDPPVFLSTLARLVPEKLVDATSKSGWPFVLGVFDRIIFYLLIISYVIVIALVFYA